MVSVVHSQTQADMRDGGFIDTTPLRGPYALQDACVSLWREADILRSE